MFYQLSTTLWPNRYHNASAMANELQMVSPSIQYCTIKIFDIPSYPGAYSITCSSQNVHFIKEIPVELFLLTYGL